MKSFIEFLSQKTFLKPDEMFFDEAVINNAVQLTFKDVAYHFNTVSIVDVINRIQSNQNELAIFLYRMGNIIYQINSESTSLKTIHWLMKELCCCEIYYSNTIGEGFYITHGTGTVIGSRNKIGNGFKIFQNCTIGHSVKYGKGNIIGDNVICYTGATIIGELTIGDNVIIGANTLITKNIPPNMIAQGNPAIIKSRLPDTKIV